MRGSSGPTEQGGLPVGFSREDDAIRVELGVHKTVLVFFDDLRELSHLLSNPPEFVSHPSVTVSSVLIRSRGWDLPPEGFNLQLL